jgi:hypothetical protein
VFISEDDATELDLSELADGETRVFGAGDKQVTVERNGDEVTITREKRGEETRSFTCRIDRDSCKVLTFEDDPAKVMIVMEKSRECHDGVGDCAVEVEADAIAVDGAQVLVKKFVDCDSQQDDDCAKLVDVIVEAHPHHGHHGEMRVRHLGASDDVLLRCPEGDALLHVDKEEAEDTFLCPKHSVPMERVSTPHKIKVITGTARDDD